MANMRTALGLETPRGYYVPRRSVIGDVELAPGGNTIIRVGHECSETEGPWEQSEHVVLTPAEVDDLMATLVSLRTGPLGGHSRSDDPLECAIASCAQTFPGVQSAAQHENAYHDGAQTCWPRSERIAAGGHRA